MKYGFCQGCGEWIPESEWEGSVYRENLFHRTDPTGEDGSCGPIHDGVPMMLSAKEVYAVLTCTRQAVFSRPYSDDAEALQSVRDRLFGVVPPREAIEDQG